jgi:SAM-dependent methyltransferase
MDQKLKMKLFYEIYSGLPQLAPGDDETTAEAFELIEFPTGTDTPRILDIGCGNGRQTLILAQESNGHVVAVDNHEPYLEELKQRAVKAGLSKAIETVEADMAELPFEHNSFDLIWSEGAIYNIGFQKGLETCYDFVKPDCYVVVSELCWIQPGAPKECLRYWENNYPDMRGDVDNLDLCERAGFEVCGQIELEPEAWENYYRPLGERLTEARIKYKDIPEAQEIIDESIEEIEIYRHYNEFFGYMFYIVQKP